MNKGMRNSDVTQGAAGYYYRVANIFRIGKYLCVLLFALFMIMMLFVYGDKITYNNFRYMLRDIDAAVLLRTDEAFATVHYRTEDPEAVVLNGNLVVADQGVVTLYNPAGIPVYSVSVDGQNLQLTADGKYLLAHASNGHSFVLCNSITRLTGGTVKGAICTSDVSACGAFAIVATSDETRYAVEVFSSSFSHCATYGLNEPTVGVSVSDDGDSLAILSFVSRGDTADTVVRFARAGVGAYSAMHTIEGEFPVLVDFGSTSVIVQTDRSVSFYTPGGEAIRACPLEGATLTAVCADDDAYAVAVQIDGEARLMLFDRSGNVQYNEKVPYHVSDLAFCEDGLLMLSPGRAMRLSLDDGALDECAVEDAFRVLGIGRYGLVCGKKQATAIFTEK